MDRHTANSLRTMGIVLISAFVMIASLLFLLLALCFGVLTPAINGPAGAAALLLIGVPLLVTALLVAGGVAAISSLARGIVRNPVLSQAPSPPITLDTVPPAVPPRPSLLFQLKALIQTEPDQGVVHLSPASSNALRNLRLAIAAKIVAEVVLGIVGWYGALGSPKAPFPLYRAGFLAWGLAAIAPHLVLLYALSRRPGRRAFAYTLVIPSLHILFGIFGHSAFLAFILRPGQLAAPWLSVVPWFLDILILYLAWKAIQRTGLLPDPRRLILASAVIFLYTSLLPLLVVILKHLQR